MSFATLRWAEKQRVGDAHRKSVLMCLAQYADEEHSCFPGQRLIADATELGERTVRRHLKRLEEDGYIERLHRHLPGRHGRHTDRYVLQLNRTTQPANLAAKGSNSTGQSEQLNRPTVTTQPATHDTPFLIEQLEEQPVEQPESARAETGFESFWEIYPRRDGKKLEKPKAKAQWKRVPKRDVDSVMVGTRNYCEACEEGLTRAKDAHRWLRDRCWEDWQTPASPDQRRDRSPNQRAFDRFKQDLDTNPMWGGSVNEQARRNDDPWISEKRLPEGEMGRGPAKGVRNGNGRPGLPVNANGSARMDTIPTLSTDYRRHTP